MPITIFKIFLTNTLEILVAALLGGFMIALGDHFMKHRAISDLPLWRDYMGRALFYAAIIWFHIYTNALFVLFLIAEIVSRTTRIPLVAALLTGMFLYALIAAVIWQEAYSYSGLDASEKRLKNTISLLSGGIVFGFYARWLSTKKWSQFPVTDEEP